MDNILEQKQEKINRLKESIQKLEKDRASLYSELQKKDALIHDLEFRLSPMKVSNRGK